jgi:hypothetical protein
MGVVSYDIAWDEDARIEQQRREWRATAKVLMANLTDGGFEMLMGLPKLNPYQPHPKDQAAFVNYFFPKRIPGTNYWDLEVRWSTDVDVSINPLAAPAQIPIQSVARQYPALFDSNGNAICNLAGDMYTEPNVERTVIDLVFQVNKNIPIQLPGWILTHPGCVNSDTVTIRGLTCPPGTLYFSAIGVGSNQNVPGATETISLINGKATPFCTTDFELSFRRDGWTILLPNWGYFQLVPTRIIPNLENTALKPKQILRLARNLYNKIGPYTRQRITIGAIGDYPPHPVFLDGNGAAIVNPTFDQIVTLEFDLHDKQPFNVLPLT